jgi:hypothetical protein
MEGKFALFLVPAQAFAVSIFLAASEALIKFQLAMGGSNMSSQVRKSRKRFTTLLALLHVYLQTG